MMLRRTLLVLMTAAWTAFAAPIDAKAADPLYAGAEGPYEVVQVPSVPLQTGDRTVEVRVVYPQADGPFPVIVLSHGTFSSKDMYERVATFWSAAGYVVLLPNHIDANFGVQPTGEDVMREIIMTRVADLSLMIDRLDEIESAVPELAGRMDRTRLVAAGHSIGTVVAMYATGLEMRNPVNGEVESHTEDRFDALVMISDPGKMALQPDDLWVGSDVPTFLGTGTEDYGRMGKGNRPTTYTMERLSGGGDVPRYFLNIEKGDHAFGGAIHRVQSGKTPDLEGLAIFNHSALAFLDATLKGSDAAAAFLDQDFAALTAGRAELTTP